MRAILAWTQGPAVPPEPARGGWGRGREGSSGLLGGSGHGPAACKPVLCCRWNRQPWEAQPLEGLPGLDDGAQEMGASWSRDADESGCSRPPPPTPPLTCAPLCLGRGGRGSSMSPVWSHKTSSGWPGTPPQALARSVPGAWLCSSCRGPRGQDRRWGGSQGAEIIRGGE